MILRDLMGVVLGDAEAGLGKGLRLPRDADFDLSDVNRAHARQSARLLLGGLDIHVVAAPQPGRPCRRHPLLARDQADRQKRRLSWQQQAGRWCSIVAIVILGGPRATFVRERLISANT